MIDGTKFVECRKTAHLTRADLARKMGIAPQVLDRAEKEVRDLSLPMAAIAAHIMGVKIEDFLKPVKM